MSRVEAIFDKHSNTTDNGWSSTQWIRRSTTTSSPLTIATYNEMPHKASHSAILWTGTEPSYPIKGGQIWANFRFHTPISPPLWYLGPVHPRHRYLSVPTTYVATHVLSGKQLNSELKHEFHIHVNWQRLFLYSLPPHHSALTSDLDGRTDTHRHLPLHHNSSIKHLSTIQRH
jgi:hypothetical protein